MPIVIKRVMVAVVGVAAMAGCSSGGPQEPDAAPETSVPADVEAVASPTPVKETTPTPTPEETETADVERSQRGNVIKEIGETAGSYTDPADPQGSIWLEFQITDIELDGSCTAEFAEPAENGAFIFVTLSVSTTSEWPSELEDINVDFIPDDWSIVGPDGLTESNLDTFATYSCLDEREMLPTGGIGPGENVVGKVALDSANTSGVLVFRPWWNGGGPGWEWEFGQGAQ
jgi:hypothetical protein